MLIVMGFDEFRWCFNRVRVFYGVGVKQKCLQFNWNVFQALAVNPIKLLIDTSYASARKELKSTMIIRIEFNVEQLLNRR